MMFASWRMVFAGQLFSVWSAEVSQKKLPVTLSACGQFAAVAACILVGNTVLVNCNAEAILFTNTRETNRS